MSDETSATIREARGDWVGDHRLRYLRSGGADGHIEDLTPVGGHSFGTNLLLKYVGRKTARVFITPLCYGVIGGEVVVVASKGGADQDPAWYLNLIDAPTVDFQIATQAFRATWRNPGGDERRKVWDVMVDNFPFYAAYQAGTAREIPLVLMKGVAMIPVFREDEATGTRPG